MNNELMKQLGIVGPHGVTVDTRTTENSNVGLTEVPPTQYNPSDPKELLSVTDGIPPLVSTGTEFIQDYPNLVRDQRLDPQWNKIKYWGER